MQSSENELELYQKKFSILPYSTVVLGIRQLRASKKSELQIVKLEKY